MLFKNFHASTIARIACLLPTLAMVPTLEAATPTSLSLEKSTHQKIGGRGDNWTLTWAKDGSTLVTMDDGNWFSSSSNTYSHAIYRINYPSANSSNFSMSNVSRLTNYPTFSYKKSCSFGYGLLSVDGVIYSMVSRCSGVNWNQFYGMKLLKSYDNGNTWYRVDKNGGEDYMGAWDANRDSRDSSEYFFYKGKGHTHYDSAVGAMTYYPFVYNTFVQAGKDYQEGLNRDGYVYIYSPDPTHASKINLARVKHYELDVRANWEYFKYYDTSGNPVWTSNIDDRGVTHSLRRTDSSGNPISWYSGLPDVVYNKGLGKYIMVNGGMYAKTYNGTDAGKNNGSGSLTFHYSDNPYGPWKELRHIDHFTATSSTERTYQPKLDPKNISSDGTRMTLIWSDHAGPFSSNYYTFNQMQIKIGVDSDSGSGESGGSGGGTYVPPTVPSTGGPVVGSSAEAEKLALNGYSIENGSRIKVSSSAANATGSAQMSFGQDSGTYDINVKVLGEDDGQSTVKLYVNGKYIGTKTFPRKNAFSTLSFSGVALSKGDVIKLVGQKDGYATFARIDGVSFSQGGSTAQPEPTTPTNPTSPTNPTPTTGEIAGKTLSLNGYKIQSNGLIAVSTSASNGTGSAQLNFAQASGSYNVNIRALGEDDGQSTVKLYANGKYIGVRTFPRKAAYTTLSFSGVQINKGDVVKMVGQKDGGATFARIESISFASQGSSTPSAPSTGGGTSAGFNSSIEAEAMTLNGYSIESGDRIKVSSNSANATGSAAATFTGTSARYTVNVDAIAENDGQSTIELYVAGSRVGSKKLSRVARDETLSFNDVAINNGQEIKLVGRKDGYATFARIDKIRLGGGSGSISNPEPSAPTTPTSPTAGGGSSMDVEAEKMSLSGYRIEGGARIVLSSSASGGTGSASFSSTVASGSYDVVARVLAENDGQSQLSLYVDGAYKGQQTFPRVVGYRDLTFSNVSLKPGQTIKLVGKKDGYATFARVDKVTIQ
ncbi:hypothetical protein [Allohahella marinimesophila]|uniref:Uncharacterized protein n=1 Tax=Allohahella marinimesophila TaxID=1054972 RepID=A0ABP7Q969_9GAMM